MKPKYNDTGKQHGTPNPPFRVEANAKPSVDINPKKSRPGGTPSRKSKRHPIAKVFDAPKKKGY